MSSQSQSQTNPKKNFKYGLLVLVALVHLYLNLLSTFPDLWHASIHFSCFAALSVFFLPTLKHWPKIAVLLAFIVMSCGFYILYGESAYFDRGQTFAVLDWVFSVLTLLFILILSSLTSGIMIPLLVIIALSYMTWLGPLLPGIFQFPGLTWETVLFRVYLSGDGLFGQIATISYSFVFMFILFGAFLVKSGTAAFIMRLSTALIGNMTGGPGLIAVISSAFMGSISGSAIANTVSTGAITIPLMKQSGYQPRFAAAIEAASSTGGQLMPPVMGAGVFIMATYTQISYIQIISIALLPALLYFLSLFFFVRIEAKKHHIDSQYNQQESIKNVLQQQGYLLVPIVILMLLLISGFTPTYAAALAILAVILVCWIKAGMACLNRSVSDKPVIESNFRQRWQQSNTMNFTTIADALALGSRNMINLALLLISIGIVVNAITTTGIGNTFSLMIQHWGSSSLLFTLVLIAIASLILGMGLPVTAAYIVLATLSAPLLNTLLSQQLLINQILTGPLTEPAQALFSLVAPGQSLHHPDEVAAVLNQLSGDMLALLKSQLLQPEVLTSTLLSAHMIIFWLSQDSNVTPPVCLAAYSAATIAGSSPIKTGFTAWKIAKGLYIIPLLFAYTPLLSGQVIETLPVFVFAAIGLYAFTAAIQGYLEGELSLFLRLLCCLLAVVLLWPCGVFYKLLATGIFMIIWFGTKPNPINSNGQGDVRNKGD